MSLSGWPGLDRRGRDAHPMNGTPGSLVLLLAPLLLHCAGGDPALMSPSPAEPPPAAQPPGAAAQAPAGPRPPEAAKKPVTDEIQGIKVTEDYRWLEKSDDPEVVKWSTAQ